MSINSALKPSIDNFIREHDFRFCSGSRTGCDDLDFAGGTAATKVCFP